MFVANLAISTYAHCDFRNRAIREKGRPAVIHIVLIKAIQFGGLAVSKGTNINIYNLPFSCPKSTQDVIIFIFELFL